MADVAIQGLSELMAKLEQLDKVAGLKVLASAARSAVKPLVEEAKRLAPVDTGALQNSIGLAVKKPRGGTIAVSAGIKVTRRKIVDEIPIPEVGIVEVEDTVDASWRWHFAEFGVPSRQIPPRPFLRPAFDSTKEQMISIFKAKLDAAIRRAIKKQNPEGEI